MRQRGPLGVGRSQFVTSERGGALCLFGVRRPQSIMFVVASPPAARSGLVRKGGSASVSEPIQLCGNFFHFGKTRIALN